MDLDLSKLPDDQSLSKQQVILLLNQIEDKHRIQEEKYQVKIDYLEDTPWRFKGYSYFSEHPEAMIEWYDAHM